MLQQVHVTRYRPKGRFGAVVFGLLAVLGAMALWKGIELLQSPEPATAVGPLMIGAILLVAGIAVPVVMRRNRPEAEARAAAQADRPGQPWTWRDDWASGRIAGSGRAATAGLWLFALVWNGFTWPIAWLFLTQKADTPHIHFVLVFPAAGLLLLALAAYSTLQRRKYGESYFVLRTNPGVIGRTLEGDVETTLTSPPAAGVEVRLLCLRRITRQVGRGSKKRHRSEVTTMWQEHLTVPAAELSRGVRGIRVPVAFEIPVDALPYDERDPRYQITWQLSVSASVPGVDYADSFDVPVFRTGAAPLTEPERERLHSRRTAHARSYVPQDPIMRTMPSPRGGSLFAFRPRVKVRSAVQAVIASALAWAGTWYLWTTGVPIAPFVVAFFALLFTIGTVVSLFHRSSVTVEEGTVVIRNRILGVGTTRRVEAVRVKDVRVEVSGDGRAQSFGVIVDTSEGQSWSAGALIPTQREADWAAEQLRAAIRGVVAKPSAVAV